MSSTTTGASLSPTIELPEITDVIPASLLRRNDLQWWRKILHVFNGSLGMFMYLLSGAPEWGVWLFCAFCMGGGAIFDLVRNYSQEFNNRALRILRPVIRDSERFGVNSMTKGLLGILIVIFFFPRRIDVLVMIFMTFGDPVGAIIGRFFGRIKLNAHASLEGSLAIFAVSAVGSWIGMSLFLPEIVWSPLTKLVFCSGAGIIAALAEGLFPNWDDNLTVPLVSAPLLYGWYMLFGY